MTEPLPINPNPPPTRLPIYMNALVYPGIGQFMQGRWLAGLVISALTAVLVVWAIVLLVPIFRTYYIQLSDFTRTPDTSVSENWRPLIVALTAWIGVYLYSIVDAMKHFRKDYTDWAMRERGLDAPAVQGDPSDAAPADR